MLGLLGAAGLGGIAGCGERESDAGSTPTDTSTPAPTETPTETQTSTPEALTVTYDGGGIEALQEAFATCREHPGSTLRVEPGTYRFESLSGSGMGSSLKLEGLEGTTVEGNGAEFVFTNPLRGAIEFQGGSDLTLRNLTVDYDPVPFTQGTITDLSEDRRTITLSLEEGYPPLDASMFDLAVLVNGRVHEPDGSYVSGTRLRGAPWKFFESTTRLGPREYELVLADRPGQTPQGLTVGRRLKIVARGGNGAAHTLHFVDVDGLTVENVDVRASPGFALRVALCSDPVVRDVTVAPPPDSGRLSGSVADGIHCVNCRDGPVVEDCRLEMLGDDGIIVAESLFEAGEFRDERTVETAFEFGPKTVTVEPGDVLEVMAPTGERKGALPPVERVEYEYGTYAQPRLVEFESPPEVLSVGDYLSNRATNSSGFEIRNNVVRDTIANSVRVNASSGVVEGNELDGAAIHNLRFDCNTEGTFPPGHWVADVTVRENTLRRAGLNYFGTPPASAIELVRDTAPDVTPAGRPNRNVEIVDNTIERCAARGMWLEDTAGLTVAGNEIRDVNLLDYEDGGYAMILENLDDARVTDNRVSGSSAHLTAFGRDEGNEAVTLSGNTLVVDGAERDARLE